MCLTLWDLFDPVGIIHHQDIIPEAPFKSNVCLPGESKGQNQNMHSQDTAYQLHMASLQLASMKWVSFSLMYNFSALLPAMVPFRSLMWPSHWQLQQKVFYLLNQHGLDPEVLSRYYAIPVCSHLVTTTSHSMLVFPSLSAFNTEVQELGSELFHLLYQRSTQVISSSQQT